MFKKVSLFSLFLLMIIACDNDDKKDVIDYSKSIIGTWEKILEKESEDDHFHPVEKWIINKDKIEIINYDSSGFLTNRIIRSYSLNKDELTIAPINVIKINVTKETLILLKEVDTYVEYSLKQNYPYELNKTN